MEQVRPEQEGAAPDLLLDLSRMNRVISVEKDNLLAKVEAGAVTANVQAAVKREGLFYPPDPTSLEESTIGGNIACAATGPRQLKYGGTRDFVMGLEVVLPSGDQIRTGANVRKSVAGYDMTRLLVGSGSRLGVVTGAILRLLPQPAHREVVLCAFSTLAAGASAALAVIRSGMTPAAMELLDQRCLEADREAWASLGIARRSDGVAESVLLFELDGVKASVAEERARIERLCAAHGEAAVVPLADPDQGRQAVELRRSLLSRLMAAHPVWAMATVAISPAQVPVLGVPDSVAMGSSGQGTGRLYCFAHAGTGLLHLFVGIDPKVAPEGAGEELALARRALGRVRSHGGALLGVYGPARRLLGEAEPVSPRLAEACAAVTRSFDPKGVMLP